MNEAQTRLNLIDPAIRAAGWTAENDCQVLVEQTVAPGRVGKVRGKPLRADYILCHRGRRLVVVEAFSLVPLWFDAVKRPRYYQELAVNRVTDAIAARQRRILLTLATGTGKTFIAFQIAWKLFKARWNLQAAEGVDVFTRDDALSQLIVTKYHTLPDASRILGDLKLISTGFATLQRAVYAA